MPTPAEPWLKAYKNGGGALAILFTKINILKMYQGSVGGGGVDDPHPFSSWYICVLAMSTGYSRPTSYSEIDKLLVLLYAA